MGGAVLHVVRVFLVRCCKSQKWRSRAAWRSFFCVLPVLGGVAHSNFFNPSTAKVLLLLMEIKAGIRMLGGVHFVVLHVFGSVANLNLRSPFIARMLCRLKEIKTGLPRLGGVFVLCFPSLVPLRS